MKTKIGQTLSTLLARALSTATSEHARQLSGLGPEIAEGIRRRTRAGLDPMLRAWSGRVGRYDRGYRQSTGKTRVDLTASGQMLNAIEAHPGPGRLVIRIRSGSVSIRALRHHYGLKGMPRRPFFGLDRTQVALILKTLRQGGRRTLTGS